MPSIAQVVSEIVEKKAFLESALATGIINYSRLAEDIVQEVRNDPKLRGTKVKQSAVMMALRRLAGSLNEDYKKLSDIIGASSSLEMDYSKYNLFSATIERSSEVNNIIRSLYDIVDIGNRDFLTITSGMTEVTIISNMRHQEEILSQFEQSAILNIDNDLASISLIIPEDSFQTPGLFYLVTKQLFWDGINIREVVSTLTEMNFIVKQIDIPDVMTSLQRLIDH